MLRFFMRLFGITTETVQKIQIGDRGLICGWDQVVDQLSEYPFKRETGDGEPFIGKDPANLRWRAVNTTSGMCVELFMPETEWDGNAIFRVEPDFFTAHFIFIVSQLHQN